MDKVTIGVYAPNNAQAIFGNNLFSLLKEIKDTHILFLGDVNAAMDVGEDRFRCTKAAVVPPIFRRVMEELQLYDVWREHHRGVKDYIFFLARHGSYSRIDMILQQKMFIGILTM